MKLISLRFAALLCAGLSSLVLVFNAQAVGQARADYRNLSSENAPNQQSNPGVASFSGYIKAPGDTQDGVVVLKNCAFGQAFSQWYPSDTYGGEVVAKVKEALYPDTSGATTRAGIEGDPEIPGSQKPFRYKWLLYTGTGTDVTAFDATSIAGWFTQADRDAIAEQIEVLKEAVAASPLDTSLRNMLLDVYYDLAVAEMQSVKPMLAKLARFHLGLEIPAIGDFVIDEEIGTYEAITDAILAAINQYTSLLSDPFPNIDPSIIDSRVAFGEMPMGRYIFLREQPRRGSVATQYANESGIQEVPKLDEDGSPIERSGGESLFIGYKDLNALLQIIGQRQQHLASLARLRGTRKAPGDLAKARASLNQVAGGDFTQLQYVRSLFPELFPPDLRTLSEDERTEVDSLLQQSGVLASLSAIELGRVDLSSLAPLLNGSANILGYDPNFLLLVQDKTSTSNPRDSYDTFVDMIRGPNAPLTEAIAKLGTFDPATGAIGDYSTFLENIDQVADDIDAADEALADRYFAITGFEPDADPGFDLRDASTATPGSELGGVRATIAALNEQQQQRARITDDLNEQFSVDVNGIKSGTAQNAFNAALEKEQNVINAGQKYKLDTSPLYEEMIAWSAASAGSQAGYEAVSDVASIVADSATGNPIKAIAGSGAGTAVAIAGAVNTGIQIAAADNIGEQEQAIDYAAIDFTVATEINDSALLVNQAAQNLSEIKREQVANHMEALSDASALQQALAQQDALLAELRRIVTKRDSSVTAIRKKSYADPLHYHRAEAALIQADESFRTAQIWMFYTLQALNYKWHGQFAITQGSKFYDTSTVFKCRNATELNDLLTAMTLWDLQRESQTTTSPRIITRISMLKHILARNPRRTFADSTDPGVRADDTVDSPGATRRTIPTLRYFRNVLNRKYRKSDGDLVIPFSTAFRSQSSDQVDGDFFRGAIYEDDGRISPGFWREKIEYVKVNIVADGPLPPGSLSGDLVYGGTTYFHTRVPPKADRSVVGLELDDAPGELLVAPFRYWVSPDFSANFVPLREKKVTFSVAYGPPAEIFTDQGNAFDNLVVPPVQDFAGLSIAATDWELILQGRTGEFDLDVSKIKDIEIIIAYRHSNRLDPSNL